MKHIVDPFEAPPPRDTIPNAAYDQLEAEIRKMEMDFIELERRLQLTQECLDGIRSSALALAAFHRKENP